MEAIQKILPRSKEEHEKTHIILVLKIMTRLGSQSTPTRRMIRKLAEIAELVTSKQYNLQLYRPKQQQQLKWHQSTIPNHL